VQADAEQIFGEFDLTKTAPCARFEFRDGRALPIAFTPAGKSLLIGEPDSSYDL
jgi:hypothetical protein